jgi:hypothetical protein
MFVTEAEILATHDINLAIDHIYREVDFLLKGGHFDVLDSILKDVSSVHEDIGLALLVSTLLAKTRLPSRKLLFAIMQELFKDDDSYMLYWLE